jgi:flagellar basal body P-ring formation protein FlgA
MRTRIIAISSAFAITVFAASPALAADGKGKALIAAPTIDVRENIEVDNTLITLGDLFTVRGELTWRPLSEHVRAVVTRRSEVIGQREIEELILDALIAKGADPTAELELGNQFMQLHVPANGNSTVQVEDTVLDARSNRFTAILAAPTGKGGMKRTRIRGRLFKTAEVPVLNRRVLIGEVITGKDIRWIKVRAGRLQNNTIVNETELVGHTPKRGLRAGDPILASAVQRPVLVPKGSLVIMVLRTPQMLLTAQGKSLQDGANGDVIRIRNPRSKTVVEAEVVGEGRVAVRPTTTVVMN